MQVEGYDVNWKLSKKGRFTFKFIYIETLLSQPEIIGQLDENGVKILINELIRKNESPTSELQKKRINIFPNPFSETGAYITLTLQQAQFVKVQVFNTIGLKVQKVFSGWLNKGDKTLVWVPNNIASGVYFLSVQCDEFNQTQKCPYFKKELFK